MSLDHKFTIDAEYTGMSLAYKNTDYVADRVLPVVSVQNEEFSYKQYPKDAFLNVARTVIGAKGEAESIDIKSEKITDSLVYHALKAEVPETEVLAASSKNDDDPIGDNTLLVTEALMLAREVRTANLVNTKETYGTNVTTLSGTDQLDDKSSSAIDVFIDARAKMLVKPNCAVMSDEAALHLQTHPDFIGMYKSEGSTNRGIVPLEFVAKCLQLKEIIVGQAVLNSAPKGKDPQLVQAWGKNIILFYKNPLAKPKYGLTFGYTAQKGTREIQRFYNGELGAKGIHIIKGVEQVKELICAPGCGYMIEAAIS